MFIKRGLGSNEFLYFPPLFKTFLTVCMVVSLNQRFFCSFKVTESMQDCLVFYFFFSFQHLFIGEPIPVILAPFDFKLKLLSLF